MNDPQEQKKAGLNSVEEAFQEIERIIREIDSGKLGIEEGLARYERGEQLIRHCRKVLDETEQRIERVHRGEE